MERVQFPIRLCFGITANKSQGQTYKRVGINLSNAEMFSHGQLYVALSRVGSAKAVSIFKPKGHPNPDHMHNVVYPEVLSEDCHQELAIHSLVGYERGLLDTPHCACDQGSDVLKKKKKISGEVKQVYL